LNHLRHEEDNIESAYIDTLLLHSPYLSFEDTVRAWKVFESYVPARIHKLGISNVPLSILQQLYEAVVVKPSTVQLRLHPETAFEGPTRRFCLDKGIVFQAHKVVKGNARLLASEIIGEVAKEMGVSKYVALYLCVLGLGGVQVVNGCKGLEHMRENSEGLKIFQEWSEKTENRSVWNN